MMPRRSALALTLLGLLAAAAGRAETSGTARAASCDQTPVLRVPERAPGAPTGTEFSRSVATLAGPERDAAILAQVLSGNLPQFLRHLEPVTLRSHDSPG